MAETQNLNHHDLVTQIWVHNHSTHITYQTTIPKVTFGSENVLLLGKLHYQESYCQECFFPTSHFEIQFSPFIN